MKILAFDTSNQTLAVAVLEDQQTIASFQLNRKMNHSLTLMPAIEHIMKMSGLAPKDLDRIVVAKGPGSYTGIRIAVTTAKTLADTLKIELVGISSLQLLAANTRDARFIVPIMDARRNNVYAGVYQWKNGQLNPIIADNHVSLDILLNQIKEEAVFVGEIEKFVEQIQAVLPTAKIETDDRVNLPSGITLGQLGEQAEPVKNIQEFVPAYLKRVEAEEKWLQTHQPEDGNYVEKI
ncbi:tRNA (adenosine(37)-N6)-threonylcarbamoyltransferase complex dimerization subunit type 1 TsaB [Candidatus Enterococcus ferrettii]|uniref:tRNA threonylcarbamoyl adenosine modification protein YeaZ n=1 Tax=Candidatus Enterococcus ferrettii TaxID=2815324 RepID=A0ABV0EW23_9ENTE|nr:tRNA (adenosine(37)-N6)-threonylcarbamoyltransferase complex dimerization subunit type 1 TsaB [Enterococcus sp. 665A]MBO1339954.1 tRNA (adenosine(37)-N6)-threonylcarbamoyltransferase complex dimerization subunit type 1 TsaB [Enterococcus sp. 665A]